MTALPDRSIMRKRHEIRVRVLDVAAITDLTPRMRRVTLAGPDLAGFTSLGYDDHIKVFFSADPDNPVIPVVGADGLGFPEGKRPEARDYTPGRFDPDALTLELDFVLHGDGPAASWAAQARTGQKLVIGGPRGSAVVPLAFDWYLLAGDETALPAITRRLAELPAGTRAVAVIEVADAGEEQTLQCKADLTLVWAHRNGAEAGTTNVLQQAIADLNLPAGDALRVHCRRGRCVTWHQDLSRWRAWFQPRMGQGRRLLAPGRRRRARAALKPSSRPQPPDQPAARQGVSDPHPGLRWRSLCSPAHRPHRAAAG